VSRSGRPFPLRASARVDAGAIPLWLAELAYARILKIAGPGAHMIPSLLDVEREGGFAPEGFLDIMAGGTGDGRASDAVERRQSALQDQALVSRPVALSARAWKPSSHPFPVQGGRVDDGTGLEPGSVPEYVAQVVLSRFRRFVLRWEKVSLQTIAAQGGLTPLQLLDGLAGGKGDGLAHRAVEKRWGGFLDVDAASSPILIVQRVPRAVPSVGAFRSAMLRMAESES
jgi:hypothetical protein